MSLLKQLFVDFWDWRLKEFPEFATFCGFHLYDNRLNDHSVDAFERKQKDAEDFLQRASVLKQDLAEGEDWLSLDLLIDDLEAFLEGIKHESYLFSICYIEGMHVDFEQLISWMPFKNIDDYEKYVARLQALPERLAADQILMEVGIAKGKTLNVYSMRSVVDQLTSLDCLPEHSVFWSPFKCVPDTICEEDISTIKEKAENLIKTEIVPAFLKLKQFIEKEYIPSCRAEIAATSLPGGESFYQQCLQWHLSVDMSPKQVHDLGLKEVTRIRKRMQEVIESINFSGDFRQFVKFLRTDSQFYFTDKEQALQAYRDLCSKQIRPKLNALFHHIPDSELIIQAAPESRPNAPVGYYLAGTLDGSRPGKYYVNVTNLSTNAKYMMMTLSLHESEPGHHFQGMYAIEMEGIPDFRRYLEDMYYLMAPSRFPLHTAYCEGWGLYCEWLGNELGLYEDPYSLFGYLSFEMHRACRLVADTGIHAFGWSYDQAVQLFMENTAIPEEFVRNEVQRYITWPGQACAYKVGEIKIKELREKASIALGARFSVRDFHDEVLKCGAVPLKLLEQIVDNYIVRVKASS